MAEMEANFMKACKLYELAHTCYVGIVCVHVHVCVCMHACTCVCVCVCVCVCGCVWVGGWVGGWVWVFVWACDNLLYLPLVQCLRASLASLTCII